MFCFVFFCLCGGEKAQNQEFIKQIQEKIRTAQNQEKKENQESLDRLIFSDMIQFE